jgi:hypothetical protein
MQDVVRGDKNKGTLIREAITDDAEGNGPLFEEGEIVALRGVPCRLQRINRSSLVFRPLKDPEIGSPRRVIREITT